MQIYAIMSTAKKVLCDCLSKCKGSKYVSPATYYRHVKLCGPSTQFSARLQHIFASNRIIYGAPLNAPEGSGFSNSSPGTEQTHGPVDDSHCKGTSVRVFGIGILGKTDV